MDCHINCHGELNLLIACVPMVSAVMLVVRRRATALLARLRRSR